MVFHLTRRCYLDEDSNSLVDPFISLPVLRTPLQVELGSIVSQAHDLYSQTPAGRPNGAAAFVIKDFLPTIFGDRGPNAIGLHIKLRPGNDAEIDSQTRISMASSTSLLKGQVALLTGGGSGIGLMIARAFVNNGAKVYITGRRLQVLEDAISSSGPAAGSIFPLQVDAVDEDAVKSAAKLIEDTDGKLDILVNNAGTNGPLHDAEKFQADKLSTADSTRMEPEVMDDWIDLFKLNTIAPYFIIRAFKSLLVKGAEARGPGATSSVINISSAAASTTHVLANNIFGYGASKAALEKLTVSLATLFASTNVPIRVNCISPGMFPSQLTINGGFIDNIATAVAPGLINPVPAKRAGTEKEMGDTALYVATTGYVNGVTLKIDGGISLVNP